MEHEEDSRFEKVIDHPAFFPLLGAAAAFVLIFMIDTAQYAYAVPAAYSLLVILLIMAVKFVADRQREGRRARLMEFGLLIFFVLVELVIVLCVAGVVGFIAFVLTKK